MKNFPSAAALALTLCLLGAGPARADDALRRIQQSLRDQGFYYGPIDGSPGDETTQALRRYQIRNGLGVTGQLNEETRQSIERAGADTRSAAPAPTPAPAPRPRTTLPPPTNERRPAPAPTPAPAYRPEVRPAPDQRTLPGRPAEDEEEDAAPAPGGRDVRPSERPDPRDAREREGIPRNGVAPSEALSDLLGGTPYEFAPPPVQGDVVRRAQAALRRDGYYDGPITGAPGPHTRDALANFQRINRLPRTGRLDAGTLQAMRLMPERREDRRRGGRDEVYQGRVVD